MIRSDKTILIVGITAAIALAAWILWQRYHALTTTNALPSSATNPYSQTAFAGPTGLPITDQIQYGQPSGAFQLNLGTITLPGFHYTGNHQIYMPMFGFVGYSNYASG